MPGSRHWCATLNNYSEEEHERLLASAREDPSPFSYIVIGEECGESGTPHLQIYFRASSRLTVSGCKKLPGLSRAHFECTRGTPLQAAEYCKKESRYVEFGTLIRQGARSDLLAVQESIDGGSSLAEVSREFFPQFVKYNRGITSYISLQRGIARSSRTAAVWLYGATGAGKSFTAHRECASLWRGDYCVLADNSLQWANPYAGHRACILDDFRGEAKLPMLLRLLDWYPLQLPEKGGFVEFSASIVYITSNVSPAFCYGDANSESFHALCRRLDQVVEYSSEGVVTEETGEEYWSRVAGPYGQ